MNAPLQSHTRTIGVPQVDDPILRRPRTAGVRNIHQNALRSTIKVVTRGNAPGQAIEQRAAEAPNTNPFW